jgi:hypothetical protein
MARLRTARHKNAVLARMVYAQTVRARVVAAAASRGRISPLHPLPAPQAKPAASRRQVASKRHAPPVAHRRHAPKVPAIPKAHRVAGAGDRPARHRRLANHARPVQARVSLPAAPVRRAAEARVTARPVKAEPVKAAFVKAGRAHAAQASAVLVQAVRAKPAIAARVKVVIAVRVATGRAASAAAEVPATAKMG